MTDKVQHTPGPWAPFWDDIPHSDIGEGWTVNAPEGSVAFCDGPADVNEANARLIAAAPELLEALKRLLPSNIGLADHLSDDAIIPVDMTMAEIRQARAAIAKARGDV